MKKLIIPFILGFIAIGSWLLAPVSYAYHDPYPSSNSQFDPRHVDYYDGNLRLKLKKRADIERASKPNVHYDQYSRDYYRCNWNYNKNLGTWVCEKSYATSSPQPVQACPFGFLLHSIQNRCVPVQMAANSHLNARGDGWECDAGYHLNYPRTGCVRNQSRNVYRTAEAEQPTYTDTEQPAYIETTKYVYVYEDEEARATRLPQTGMGSGLILVASVLGSHCLLRRKKKIR